MRYKTFSKIDPKLIKEAKELFKKLSPSISDKDLSKVVDFGFGLSNKPEDLIESLKDQLDNCKKFSDGECPESGCIQKKPNGCWGIISNHTGEFWEPDYESEDAAKNALAAYHAGKYFSDLRLKLTKKFSDEDYSFNANTLESSNEGMESLIGTVIYSIAYAHMYHLTTPKYGAHKALQEYYETMPDVIDALAESWLELVDKAEFSNAVLPGPCPIEYFTALRSYVLHIREVGDWASPYESQIDAIIEVITSLLYKLKRLNSGHALFSELSVEDYKGVDRTAREGEEPIDLVQRIHEEKLEALKNQDIDPSDATFSKLSKFSSRVQKYYCNK